MQIIGTPAPCIPSEGYEVAAVLGSSLGRRGEGEYRGKKAVEWEREEGGKEVKKNVGMGGMPMLYPRVIHLGRGRCRHPS